METNRTRLKFYKLMMSLTLNYITIIINKHMEQSMHINVGIPVTITYVKENKGKLFLWTP